MLIEYRAYLVSRRRAVATIRLRTMHIRHLQKEHANLLALTTHDLEAYIDRKAPNWQPETINAVISSIRGFYKWAHRVGKISDNPAIWLEPVSAPRKISRIADDAAILDALERATPQERAVLLLGRVCGMRRAEIAAAHSGNRKGEFLRVLGKGNKTREVHLDANILATLTALEETQGSGYYFPGRYGGHVGVQWVYDAVERLIGMNPHSLRHAAGTAVYAKTKDIRVTQEFLGHSSIETTMIYVHVDRDSLRVASDAASLPHAA